MALVNNMVVSKKDDEELAEAMEQREPGQEIWARVRLTIVENLLDKASFDVEEMHVEGSESASSDEPDDQPAGDAALANSVLGVMAKKKKS